MKAKLIVSTLFMLAGFSMLASAENNTEKTKMVMVSINKEDDANARVDLQINGEKFEFELPELTEGESQDITTASGQSIAVSKTSKGFIIKVDGEEIPLFSDQKLHFDDSSKSARVFAFVSANRPQNDEEMVISASGLDDETRTRIKEALMSAGIDKKVIFTDMSQGMQWLDNEGGTFDITVEADDGSATKHKVIKMHKKVEIDTDDDS